MSGHPITQKAAFMLMKDYDLARESSSTKYEEEMEDPEFEAPYLEPFVVKKDILDLIKEYEEKAVRKAIEGVS
ncbi:hypothetical protein WN944_027033 [Citrus x changshan-huyou]|uniref:Uncharacterized protein n=1 Tax=Citrus x changshan-huyou TaxID=2935761 RepID=A0AAP0LL46_9ROSI